MTVEEAKRAAEMLTPSAQDVMSVPCYVKSGLNLGDPCYVMQTPWAQKGE